MTTTCTTHIGIGSIIAVVGRHSIVSRHGLILVVVTSMIHICHFGQCAMIGHGGCGSGRRRGRIVTIRVLVLVVGSGGCCLDDFS